MNSKAPGGPEGESGPQLPGLLLLLKSLGGKVLSGGRTGAGQETAGQLGADWP